VTIPLTDESVRENLLGFVEQRTKKRWTAEEDLFDSGVVSSLFALELVVHLENTFGVTIGGEDLTIGNFRTVNLMTALVLRLRGADD
jgi:methoxymalonate biosynthesis acyl carrier protein